MAWTEERVSLLTKWWAEGASASVIAAKLGDTTRNAVIGRVHRMKLPSHTSPQQAGKQAKTNRRRAKARAKAKTNGHAAPVRLVPALPRPPHLPPTPFVPKPDLFIPPAERKTLQMLENCDCRWPIGDPQSADFHFCGRPKVPGWPYCDFHVERASGSPQPQRPVPVPVKQEEVAA